MTDTGWSALKPWNDLQIRDDENRVVFNFGLTATLYFHQGHTEEKRAAVLSCFNEYDQLCGKFLRWCVAEGKQMGLVSKLSSRDMAPYLLSSNWNQEAAAAHAWSFYWHGGEDSDSSSPFMAHGFGSSRIQGETKNSLSFFCVSFPVLFFRDKPERFGEIILGWSRRLNPHHGYGGVSITQTSNDGLAQAYGPEIAGYVTRYPGIDLDRPMSHKFSTQDGIKGAHWATILSHRFANCLGGAGGIRGQLGPPYAVAEYESGVFIVAGDVPEIGDRNAHIDTPLLRRLARVLAPIRIRDHPTIQAGRFAEPGAYAEWLARFDE